MRTLYPLICICCLFVLSAVSSYSDHLPSIKIEKRHLWIPRDDNAPRVLVRLLDGAREVRRFEVQMADNNRTSLWADIDLDPWRGKTLAVEILPKNAGISPSLFRQSDTPFRPKDLYKEPLRPQTRFSARAGRLNDPNGLCYYEGEYHLFFQFAPYSASSGSKHWGHAVSKDLVHWKETDIALFPDEKGMVFSGSAVVDRRNTSGLGRQGKAPMVLHYTVAPTKVGPKGLQTLRNRYQSFAYSLDGHTFKDCREESTVAYFAPGNRDPKVVWHEPSRQWIMALYAGAKLPAQGSARSKPLNIARVHFFGSKDMRRWEKLSEFDGESPEQTGKLLNYLSECPDLFSLSAPDGTTKWILTGGKGKYRIGDFDGKRFIPETGVIALWEGARYAAQTFANTPDGKTYQIGWMIGSEFPGMPFNQCMDLPVELSLAETAEGLRMRAWPVAALAALPKSPVALPQKRLGEGDFPLPFGDATAYEIECAIRIEGAQTIVLSLPKAELTYDVPSQRLSAGKESLPVPLQEGVLKLRIFGDSTVLQVFRADGLHHLSLADLPSKAHKPWSLRVEGGQAVVESFTFYPLGSIWND